MNLHKLSEPKIDPLNPWHDDELGRFDSGQLLLRLVKSLSGSYVIALKGKWGSGKSVFLKRMSYELENNQVPVIALDAWRNDHLTDPLLAFLNALTRRLEDGKKTGKAAKADAIISKLTDSATAILPPLTAAFAAVINPAAAPAAAVAATAVQSVGTRLLHWDKARRAAAATFERKLEDARDFLTNRDPNGPILPVVVAIDELDRCRPDFAMRLLECAKHFFEVPGIIFLIATDGENLPNAVSTLYGPKVSGEVYLRKFFDFEFNLPEPNTKQFLTVLQTQFAIDTLFENDDFAIRESKYTQVDGGYQALVKARDRKLDMYEIVSAFPQIAELLSLSLRDQGQAFTILNAYFRSSHEATVMFPKPLVVSVCARFFAFEKYEAVRLGRASFHDLLAGGPEPSVGQRLSPWMDSPGGWDCRYFADLSSAASEKDLHMKMRALYEATAANISHTQHSAIDRVIARVNAAGWKATHEYVRRALSLLDTFG